MPLRRTRAVARAVGKFAVFVPTLWAVLAARVVVPRMQSEWEAARPLAQAEVLAVNASADNSSAVVRLWVLEPPFAAEVLLPAGEALPADGDVVPGYLAAGQPPEFVWGSRPSFPKPAFVRLPAMLALFAGTTALSAALLKFGGSGAPPPAAAPQRSHNRCRCPCSGSCRSSASATQPS